jgi:hypothetical protein
MRKILTIIFFFLLSSCTPMVIHTPTETLIPTMAASLIPATPTDKPTSTPEPSKTPIPIVYITLGSPFAADCGSGTPRIWSNDSPNGDWRRIEPDQHHGHVDIFAPSGCNPQAYEGEVIAPISGYLIQGDKSDVYFLKPEPNTYLAGMEEAIKKGGVPGDIRLRNINEWYLNLGHFQSNKVNQWVSKGEKIGDLVLAAQQWKVAFQISVYYESGTDILPLSFSPTVFTIDPPNWPCVEGSPYDCEAVFQDYNK